MDLLREHAEEALPPGIPFDPDFGRAIRLEAEGVYRLWVARDGKTLAGYVGWYVMPHMHSRTTLAAIADAVFLSAPFRRGAAGINLVMTPLPALKELGVRWVICDMPERYTPMMRRLGFAQTSPGWRKLL